MAKRSNLTINMIWPTTTNCSGLVRKVLVGLVLTSSMMQLPGSKPNGAMCLMCCLPMNDSGYLFGLDENMKLLSFECRIL